MLVNILSVFREVGQPTLFLGLVLLHLVPTGETLDIQSIANGSGYVFLKTRFGDLIGNVEQSSPGLSRHETKEFKYYTFRGIPFAESPTGSRRWQDPIMKPPLTAQLNATKSGPPCPQSEGKSKVLIGDEDCLFADIFIPFNRSLKQPLKIMVFFHGGGFLKNTNRNTSPVPLLMQQNVMVVLFNYRLNIFGYLSTGTGDMAGNYGALDQIMLLKWIQLYGKDFGGDPNDVTLFGSSIGSVSIQYLLLSKLASGLFHGAIMESGSAYCERSMVPNPLHITAKLGAEVDCHITEPSQLTTCLRRKSTKELMTAANSLTTDWALPTVLAPVIDKHSRPPGLQFLPEHPENLLVANKVPVIAGITEFEGLTAFAFLSQSFSLRQLNDLEHVRNVILPKYLNLIMRSRNIPSRSKYIEDLTSQVMAFYKDGFASDSVTTLVKILGDLWINACHRKTVEVLCASNVPSVFPYLFTHHDKDVSPSEIGEQVKAFHDKGIKHPLLDEGAAHTEEILYLLQDEKDSGSAGIRLTMFARNTMMSEALSSMWTQFALYKDPGPASTSQIFAKWPKWNPVCRGHNYTDPDLPLYEINLNHHRIFKNYRAKEAQFWWHIHRDTYP